MKSEIEVYIKALLEKLALKGAALLSTHSGDPINAVIANSYSINRLIPM